MFDAKKLLDQLLGSEVPGAGGTVRDRAGQLGQLAKDNPLATGAIAAVLLGTGTGRQLTGSVLKLGGLAAIAGLGYQAYKNWQAGQDPQATPAPASADPSGVSPTGALPGAAEPVLLPAPQGTGFHVDDVANSPDFAVNLVRVMIAAAQADGTIDEAERQAIVGKVKLAGLDPDAEAFLTRELSGPVNLDAIVASAGSDSQKVELYTAARIAIDPDNEDEQRFLQYLAGKLGLAGDLVAHIDATVAGAKAA